MQAACLVNVLLPTLDVEVTASCLMPILAERCNVLLVKAFSAC